MPQTVLTPKTESQRHETARRASRTETRKTAATVKTAAPARPAATKTAAPPRGATLKIVPRTAAGKAAINYVIGGGLAGLSAAAALAEQGRQVTLIEGAPQAGDGHQPALREVHGKHQPDGERHHGGRGARLLSAGLAEGRVARR